MRRHVSVLLLSSSLPLLAQSDRLTAHPQATPHAGSVQGIAFGNLVNWCEARCQMLIYSRHLPGPGAVLIGIEFHASAAATVTYETLEITVSPVSPAAPRSNTFDANLPLPIVIVQLANQPQTWTGTGWDRFPAAAPYVHDGVSDLTIDIKKDAALGSNFGLCRAGQRPDLAPTLAAWGGPGSGQNLASSASGPIGSIDVRLVWSNAPTSYLSSPVPGAAHHGFAIGSTLDHVVMAAPGSLAALAGDLQFAAPITLPFAAGQWWVQGFVLGLDVLAANGAAVRTYPIPALPAFVGQQLAYQSLVLDVAASQFAFTNASDCFLGQ